MERINRTFYWMAVPALLLFALFHTIPLLRGIFYSFTDYRGFGEWSFVGLRNYVALTVDDRVIASYLFTFRFAIVATLLVNIVALAIALGLNSKIRFRNGLRAIFFVPNLLSIVIVGFIFNYIFAFLLPQLGASAGIAALSTNLLGDPDLAWVGVVVVSVWQSAAFAIVLYLAGLQTVPQEQLEAAAIDGASAWNRFRHIVFPLIAPFFTINVVLSMKNFLMAFDQVIALTGGGPGTSTETISLTIYRGGFQGSEFAYQSANAVVFFFVLAAVAIVQLRYLQRREVSA
jgi:raffinose/stachyose/melibiose transport system permease protein